MEKIVVGGKNLQAAIANGLEKLSATKEEVEYEVLTAGGLFRQCKIEIWKKQTEGDVYDDLSSENYVDVISDVVNRDPKRALKTFNDISSIKADEAKDIAKIYVNDILYEDLDMMNDIYYEFLDIHVEYLKQECVDYFAKKLLRKRVAETQIAKKDKKLNESAQWRRLFEIFDEGNSEWMKRTLEGIARGINGSFTNRDKIELNFIKSDNNMYKVTISGGFDSSFDSNMLEDLYQKVTGYNIADEVDGEEIGISIPYWRASISPIALYLDDVVSKVANLDDEDLLSKSKVMNIIKSASKGDINWDYKKVDRSSDTGGYITVEVYANYYLDKYEKEFKRDIYTK